jgi:RNA polymerase-associated protein LEO1
LGSGDRKLDDAELDSGDDEGRRDRIADTIEDDDDDDEAAEDRVVQIYPSDIGRMAEPEPGDGDVSSEQQALMSTS